MTDQQNEIRSRVARMARERRKKPVLQAQNIYIPEKEKPSFIGAFLITCILLLAIATVPVMYYKAQDNRVLETEPTPTPVQQPVNPKIEWDEYNAFASRLAALETTQKAQSHHLWLAVLAHNETANLLKKMDIQHHKVKDRGFITFDEDWRMSKMPETMEFTPEQEDQIRNDVR